MLFSLIKLTTTQKQFKLGTPFVVKSKFIHFEFEKCFTYKESRVNYLPLIVNQTNYKLLIRAWYLLLAIRMVKAPLIGGRGAIFPHRSTKLFAKHQDIYELSVITHPYETIVEHRNLFYCLSIPRLSLDRLSLILSLHSLKIKDSRITTVIRKSHILNNSYIDLFKFILQIKWKFKVIEFVDN
jgi:hypothetical protein